LGVKKKRKSSKEDFRGAAFESGEQCGIWSMLRCLERK
jgi:hypothetical protein